MFHLIVLDYGVDSEWRKSLHQLMRRQGVETFINFSRL